MGARRGRRLRVRLRPADRRPRPRHRADPRADPREVRAGRRRPVQPRPAVGPAGLPRAVGGGAARRRGGDGGLSARGSRAAPGVGTPRHRPGRRAPGSARRGAPMGRGGPGARDGARRRRHLRVPSADPRVRGSVGRRVGRGRRPSVRGRPSSPRASRSAIPAGSSSPATRWRRHSPSATSDRAAAIEATLEEAARIAPTPWVVAVGARSAGLLAAARGDLDGAAAAFDRALRRARSAPDAVRAGAHDPGARASSIAAARRSDSPTRRCAPRWRPSRSSARPSGRIGRGWSSLASGDGRTRRRS